MNQQNYNNNKDISTNNSKGTAQPVTSTNYNIRQNNNYNYSNVNKTNISRSTLQSNVNNNMQQSNNKNNTLQSTGYSKVNYNNKYNNNIDDYKYKNIILRGNNHIYDEYDYMVDDNNNYFDERIWRL